VPWVQLWENGPKWACYNVGATVLDYSKVTKDKMQRLETQIHYYFDANESTGSGCYYENGGPCGIPGYLAEGEGGDYNGAVFFLPKEILGLLAALSVPS